ncbi:hypothetical protein BKA67DRAFT_566253 [Truncatella angustata]|uniref:Vacuolar ATPase assembly protein VMA22 n=1 Tax=Truncatella angustata TaxID=152316 RepID=A0A9P8ZZA4_9PEZI|nr:uncharacterized protein BKA67DRAFT_566253 [Truncatella angustata]KAH6654800.1 hypothetical protein BKA67DRAFT_566253 [Truncatella angustata]
MEGREIDTLLERYLHLLHEYTTLRTELRNLQTGIYQNIARANFTAERGMRYGRDLYDDRMQASRRVKVNCSEEGVLSFQVAKDDVAGNRLKNSDDAPQAKEENTEEDDSSGDINNSADSEEQTAKKARKKDPLRWFGLLTPMPLRQAQGQSIKAVEEVIPRLVTVQGEMQYLEIEVRRARKKRAKAEAHAKKEGEGIPSQEVTA